MSDPKDNYTVMQYKCGYCRMEFIRPVKLVMNDPPMGVDPKGAVSTKVICPKCGNFLKTWEDGNEIGTTDKLHEVRRMRQGDGGLAGGAWT